MVGKCPVTRIGCVGDEILVTVEVLEPPWERVHTVRGGLLPPIVFPGLLASSGPGDSRRFQKMESSPRTGTNAREPKGWRTTEVKGVIAIVCRTTYA